MTRAEIIMALRCHGTEREKGNCETHRRDGTCVECIAQYQKEAADMLERDGDGA